MLPLPVPSPPSPSSGAILVAHSLDYETCKDYFLTVEARDGGSPPLSAITTVNINLTDVNDNAPMFSFDVYSAVVSEDATIGESVFQVSSGQILACFDFTRFENENPGDCCRFT